MTRKKLRTTAKPRAGAEITAPSTATPVPPALSPLRLALLALGFSLWTGLVEEIPVFLAPAGGVVVRLSRDFIWMTPLSHGLFFSLAGLGLFFLGRFWASVGSRPVAMGVFAGLSTLALGLVLERLHPLAVLILAVGVGVQVRQKTRPLSPSRGVAPVAVGLGLAIVLGLSARMEWTEWRTRSQWVASLPSPAQEAPNILLLILDTVRGISLDFLAPDASASEWHPVHPPALEALAEGSVVFTKAMAPSPWTLPSHASMFTGRWPNQLSGGRELSLNWMGTLGPEYPTIAEVLRRRGYATGGFVGNLVFTSAETGLSRGFLTYEDYTVSLGQILLSSALGRTLSENNLWRRLVGYHDTLNRKSAETVANEFLRWQRKQEDRPFFAFLNFFDSHEPYFPPDSVARSLPPGEEWNRFSHFVGLLTGATAWRTDKWTMTAAERNAHAAGYHDSILRADRQIQRLLTELQERGVLENTIVIISSDHGEQLGEHRLYNHNNSLYLPLLHVPLLIHDPRSPHAVGRVGDVVSLRHMAATILDLAGVEPGRSRIPGNSLARYWAPDNPDASTAKDFPPDTAFALLNRGAVDRPWYPVGWGPTMYSLVDSNYHYIRNGDGTEELYNYEVDPAEASDLAGNATFEGVMEGFRETLQILVTDPPPTREHPVFHPVPPPPGG